MLAAIAALLLAAPAANAAWEGPKRVDNAGATDLQSVDGDIATGANGLTTVFFWQRRTGQGGSAGFPHMARRGAADPAWGAPVPMTAANQNASTATALAAGPDGGAVGAFKFTAGVGNVVHLAKWPVADAQPSFVAANQATVSEAPDIATDGAGNAFAAYKTKVGNEEGIYLFRYDASAGAWNTTPLTVTTETETGGDVSNPRIDVNADGDIAVSYVRVKMANQLSSTRTVIAAKRRLSGQANFSPELIVSQDQAADPSAQSSGNTESDPVSEHDVAIDEAGNIMFAFAADPGRPRTPVSDQGNITFNRIYTRRWQATSNVANPSPQDIAANNAVSDRDPDAPSAFNPKLDVSPQGRFTLAWRQHSSPTQPEQSPGQSSRLFTSEYSGSWSQPPAQVSGDDLEGNAYDLVVDSAGTATFAWIGDGQVLSRRRAPGKPLADDTDVVSQTGLLAGGVDTGFAPRLAAGGTQVDAFFLQTVPATEVRQGFANRFVPAAAPPAEPPREPDQPDPVDCPAGNAELIGTDGDDDIGGTAGNDTMRGLGGIDTLTGFGGNDCIRGGAGNDKSLSGGDGFDEIDGEDGNDTLSGGAGNDAMSGGEGNDELFGESGIDALAGGPGDDRLVSASGRDAVLGGEGADRIFSGSGADGVSGDAGNDVIGSGSGRDIVFGADGDDRINTGGSADTASGGEGNDRLSGRNGADKLFGENGDDRLFGGSGNDILDGGDGLDRLYGHRGNDILTGGDGAGRLYGHGGRDVLTGGDAADRLRGGNSRDHLFGGDGNDTLNGDRGKDKVDAGAGNDFVNSADGQRDHIKCGAGFDRVRADRKDRIELDCERVKRVRKKRKRSR